MNAVTETIPAQTVTGVEIFVPLNKLKKSPRNARKVPHGEAAIEALAASIHHKGLIQNLVVEPEMKGETPTGFYFVTAGEGRRQAQLLRVKRKQIRKAEPVRCWLDTSNDPSEISLDENITRTAMHPADQFERFHELSSDRGWGAEEIGARFGVSPEVVKRRLRLGAVSPKLMEIYRQAAPFKRNDRMLESLPVGLVVFPGTGIQDNLADKARKMGIPLWDFRDRKPV